MGDWLLIAECWFSIEVNRLQYHPIINRESTIKKPSTIKDLQIGNARDWLCRASV
jgi:hypothetical protein